MRNETLLMDAETARRVAKQVGADNARLTESLQKAFAGAAVNMAALSEELRASKVKRRRAQQQGA